MTCWVVVYEANPALLFSSERNGVAGCTGCPERIIWLGTFQERKRKGVVKSKRRC
jgi:hypothetical protein